MFMNQGVYEIFVFCRFFSLLGNCTNFNIKITMFACKDKRYKLDFECIRFFLMLYEGSKDQSMTKGFALKIQHDAHQINLSCNNVI